MASVQASVPDNKNFLSPIGFQFTVKKLPKVNYFCTAASIPDLSLASIDTFETPFSKVPLPGEKLGFSPLNVTFRIDEDLGNYQEIYDWMIALGFPDNYAQRRGIQRTAAMKDAYSDGSMIIMTNQYKPNIEVKFVDLYPLSISSVEFNITNEDVTYLEAQATFAYRKYELNTAL